VTRLSARLAYFGRTALRGLAASPLPSGVAVITIATTLLLVGALALLVANMQGLLDRVARDLRVSAYLADDLSDSARTELLQRARTLPGVASVTLVDKQEALRRFQAGAGGRSGLLEGLDENPLPASLELSLATQARSAAGLRRLSEAVAALPGVVQVSSSQDWVDGYVRAVDLVRAVGGVLGGVLGLAALLIVANTIRLAVYARRDELEILALVGASRAVVGIPFVLEGALQGTAGGTLALGLLYALFRLLAPALGPDLALVLGFVEPRFLTPVGMAALVAAGTALGILGSLLSLVGGRPR
jgi:cell division transport system permease protein